MARFGRHGGHPSGRIGGLFLSIDWRCTMSPLKRRGVNKRSSAKKFKRNVGRTKAANMSMMPMRGGWRL